MINLPVGSIVKGFAKLGLQKKENWARGTYLGNNKVEFWTGAVLILEDRNIKEYRRIESNSTVQSDFINSSWEALKDNVQQAVSAFFPDVCVQFDEDEHIIYALDNCLSICPAIVEKNTFCSIIEIPTWQVCEEVYYSSTQWEPSGSDLCEVADSPNPISAAKLFVDRIWSYKTDGFWQNKYDDAYAKDFCED